MGNVLYFIPTYHLLTDIAICFFLVFMLIVTKTNVIEHCRVFNLQYNNKIWQEVRTYIRNKYIFLLYFRQHKSMRLQTDPQS